MELGTVGESHDLIIVGGALLAWHELRESTTDVDSIARLDWELRAVASDVAARHDLRID